MGVFTEPEPGVYALTPLGQTLTSGQPGSMRDLAIMFMETHYAPFGDLLHTIRTGQPAAERCYGQPFFSWLSDHPEQASRYTAAMANLTGAFKTAAIPALPLDGARTIVDVGGADGAVLAAILTAHPQLRGVLFDLPHVISGAPRTLAATASRTGPAAQAATSSNRCRPARTPTCSPSSCTTGPMTRPGASWPTSPPPAAAARGCCCSTSWYRPATARTWPRSPVLGQQRRRHRDPGQPGQRDQPAHHRHRPGQPDLDGGHPGGAGTVVQPSSVRLRQRPSRADGHADVAGGLLLSVFPWSSIFWVNVPIGIVTVVITQVAVAESREPVPRPLAAADLRICRVLRRRLAFAGRGRVAVGSSPRASTPPSGHRADRPSLNGRSLIGS